MPSVNQPHEVFLHFFSKGIDNGTAYTDLDLGAAQVIILSLLT